MTFCTLLQPGIDFLQQLVNAAYFGLNILGIPTPPVSSWFSPITELLFGCALT